MQSDDAISVADLPIVERDSKVRMVQSMLDECRNRSGGTVLIEGVFGSGKSALLRRLCERASDADFRILQARGSEFEVEFPYGLVCQLFERWLASASDDQRAAALAGPAALAAPLFEFGSGALRGEQVPGRCQEVLRGLYWMCVNLAADRPLLIALDDIHWADPLSLRFLAYLESRLDSHPILCIATMESLNRGKLPDETQALLLSPTVRYLTVEALGEPGVRQLLAAVLGYEPDQSLVDACCVATTGHPYFLRELLTELFQSKECAADVANVHRIGPRAVARVVLNRAQQLPGGQGRTALTLLQALAVLGSVADSGQLAQVAELDPTQVTEVTSALMDIGVVAADPPLRFAHPIARNAVYQFLPQTFRNGAHARAALTLDRSGAPPMKVAEHLLHTPTAMDTKVVDVLVAAGRAALAAGDQAAAVVLYRRALSESTWTDVSPELLAQLGAAELRARDPAAVDHLRQALDGTTDLPKRAMITLNLSNALCAAVCYREALEVLQSVHAEVSAKHPDHGLRLHSEIIKIAQLSADTRAVAEHALARTDVDRGADRGAIALLRAQQAFEFLINGEPATRVIDMCDQALLQGPLLGEPDGRAQASWLVAFCLSCCDRLSEAGALLDAAIGQAESLRFGLATDDLRALRAYVNLQRGMLGEAETDATAVLDVAHHDGVPALGRPFAVSALVDALLLRDQVSGAVRAYDRYELRTDIPAETLFLPLLVSRGRLRAAQGDREAGALDLLRTCELLDEWGARCPAFTPLGHACAALVGLGRFPEARRLAERNLADARKFGSARTIAVALLATALAGDGVDRLESLEEAVELLQDSPALVDRCTALIQFGAALRHGGHPLRARRQLRAASEIAFSVGASALGKQARRELAVMGVRVRESPRAGVAGLTPREHRVSVLAAEGKRNQEIARILFVTVKTVEWHLSQAYRKLGIASRNELREALAIADRPG